MPLAIRRRDAPEATDWRQDDTVARLTEKLLRLDARDRLDRVAKAIAIGGLLRTIRDRLSHGLWVAWVDEAVPYTHHTALQYIELDTLREKHPEDFARFRHLGPTKLHRLLSQPAKIRRVFRRVRVRIPDLDVLKPLDLMTLNEIDAVIRDLVATPPPKTPISRLLTAYDSKLGQLDAKTDDLLDRAAEIDRSQAAALHDRLRSILDKLESGLDL